MQRSREVDAALEFVRCFSAVYAPEAGVVLLAGSRSRGNADANSDYDLVVLCRHLESGARREMVRFKEADMEVFVHDPGTLAYFCRNVERPSAKPVLAALIVEGLPAIVRDAELLNEARKIAGALMEQGPEPMAAHAIESGRYSITNLAEALQGPVATIVRLSLGSSLFVALSEFALLTKGRWIASGKAIPAAFSAADPGMEERFASAFDVLFTRGDAAPVQELVDDVLGPFGGRLRAGYIQQAPREWRSEVKL